MSQEKLLQAVDVFVGNRMRQRRLELGLTQQGLAEQIGMSFQQLQKYETGRNRVSASRLYHIALLLGVPVSFFFDHIEGELDAITHKDNPYDGLSDQPQSVFSATNAKSQRETQRLLSAYFSINDRKLRQKVLEITQSLGAGQQTDAE